MHGPRPLRRPVRAARPLPPACYNCAVRSLLLVVCLAALVSPVTPGCRPRADRPQPTPSAASGPAAEGAAPAPTVADSAAFYAAQPRFLRPVPASPTPAGLPNVRSETCGACHAAFYAEWSMSTHAHAWTDDAQFMAELHKSEKQGVDWMCVNCHTPVTTQLPQLVVSLEDGAKNRPVRIPNPDFDPAMQDDAIGCATCHVRDGAVLGPYGDTAAPHATRKAPELLTPDVCTQCHQASAYFPEIELLCAFQTGTEYLEGPYPAQGKTCQSCHMPSVERPLMTGMAPRPTRRHTFGGSLIPKAPRFAAEVAEMSRYTPHGLTFAWDAVPASLPPGPHTLTATYTNAAAGHRLPSGDPERWITVRATVETADGAVLASAEERIGSVYEWWPEVRKISDNRLAPLEARTLTLAFDAAPGAPLTLQLHARKGRLSPEVMEFHQLEGKAVPYIDFVQETVSVPVR
jgi:hypothetical protein